MTLPQKIIILGCGFGGIYTALELQRRLKGSPEVEITLVGKDNFLLFTPMLHEVAASDLDPTDIVNPIRKLLTSVNFFCGGVDKIDLDSKQVTVSHGDTHHSHTLDFDHLVLALGSVTSFHGNQSLERNALTMKSVSDAIKLKNQMIRLLEEADFECCKEIRGRLLTFVVAGGGFAGVETVAAMNDFLHNVLPVYRNLKRDDIKVILANSGDVVLPELHRKLGEYTGKLLEKRGVKICYKTKVTGFENGTATFSNGEKFETCTLVWTAGTAPNPLLESLQIKKEKGKILVDQTLRVSEREGVWALGDCAAIPNGEEGFHPPTAQHAIREARTVARNIIASIENRSLEDFHFKTLGQLASLGHHSGVAQVLGFRFSGFIAWWMWRMIYLSKLPRMEKRVRVCLNWVMDVLFSKDNVQIN